jgi:hypothetical protein
MTFKGLREEQDDDGRRDVMERCCIESLALKGIADGFQLTPEGGEWTCDQCGRYYQIHGVSGGRRSSALDVQPSRSIPMTSNTRTAGAVVSSSSS